MSNSGKIVKVAGPLVVSENMSLMLFMFPTRS